MKAPISWLREYVEVQEDIEELCESLSIAGFEVDSIEDMGKSVEEIIIGFVEKVEKHPNADKLKVCQVTIGDGKTLQIVCGAPNVKSKTHVLVAQVGTYLPAIGLKIKKSDIRGVTSYGMICSYDELGLANGSQGIAILEELNNGEPKVGKSPKEILNLNDTVIELAITANRPDGMSIVGIAREIAALRNLKFNYKQSEEYKEYKIFNSLNNNQTAIKANGIYSLHYIEGVDGSVSSPQWIKERLSKAGINSINAIVDITNYVMLETGQPLHAFDVDRLNELLGHDINIKDIQVQNSKDEQSFIGIDGKKYCLNKECNIITCKDIPIALSGVIGSENSSVKKTTKRIIIEAALFSPSSVRINSRKVGLRTESSSRYEKGISEHLTLPAASRAIELLEMIFSSKVVDCLKNKDQKEEILPIHLRLSRVHKILGKKGIKSNIETLKEIQSENDPNRKEELNFVSQKEIESILNALACTYQKKEDGWDVIVPPYRSSDLTREIDLIEEIARLIGYDSFESNLPQPVKPGGLTPYQIAERNLRKYFVASGLQEVTTFSLVPDDKNNKEQVPISNPLLKETSHLRTNIWREHLNICKRNIDAGQNACWLFEIGKVYKKEKENLQEFKILSGTITGPKQLENWSRTTSSNNIGYFEARGKLQQVLQAMKLNPEDKITNNKDHLHPGKSAELFIEGKAIGFFGQVHPRIISKMNLNLNTYIFELDLEKLLASSTRTNKWVVRVKDFPTVPSMDRDISLILPSNTLANEGIKLIKKIGRKLLEEVEIIDRYEGKNIDQDKIAMTFRLIYRKADRTLTDEDINPIHSKILKSLVKELGAELRQ